MRKKLHIILFIVVAISLSSCGWTKKGSYNKLLKSSDYNAKYEAAMKYYNQEDYFKATQLFENLSLYYRGRERAEAVALYHAKSLVGMKDYYSAGFQFDLYFRQFPYSENAEEALYLSAYCKYLESPVYSLDQRLTKDAITSFNLYLEKYPNSPRIEKVNQYIDELRAKIIKKDYETAYNYYKIYAFSSAHLALNEFLYKYPNSIYREDAMFYLIKSGYEYAKNSIVEKQLIRYKQLINDIDKFIVYFDQSSYKKEVQKIYEKGKAEITLLENNKEK